MPKVSQNPLASEMRHEVIFALTNTLAKITEDGLIARFLDDLLTPMEKLMLGKRLMAAVLLQRGYSYGAVCHVLKMSKTTIHLIQRDLLKAGDGYKKVFDLFFKETKKQKIINAIERFLDAATLPVKGSPSSMRRWKRALHRVGDA